MTNIDISLDRKKSTPDNHSWNVSLTSSSLRGGEIVSLFRVAADQVFHAKPLVFRGERITLTCGRQAMPTDRMCRHGAADVLRRAADELAKTPGYAL